MHRLPERKDYRDLPSLDDVNATAVEALLAMPPLEAVARVHNVQIVLLYGILRQMPREKRGAFLDAITGYILRQHDFVADLFT